jgi:hypothetical protein
MGRGVNPVGSEQSIEREVRRHLAAIRRRISQTNENTILRRYFGTLGDSRATACTLAWYHVEQYLSAARQQIQRIERGRRMTNAMVKRIEEDLAHRKFAPPRRSPGENIWFDAHFYFICWHMIGSLLRHIDHLCQLRRLKRFMHMKRALIDRYIQVRNHLEHWVERLPGGACVHVMQLRQGTRPEPRTPGGYYFGLGRKNWDISKTSLGELTGLIRGFRRTLIEAAAAGEPLGGKSLEGG